MRLRANALIGALVAIVNEHGDVEVILDVDGGALDAPLVDVENGHAVARLPVVPDAEE